jgi:hypothetical protein
MCGEAAEAFALRQITGFSEKLLLALPVAVYTTDAQELITSYNEAAVKLWRCRPEIGKTEYCGPTGSIGLMARRLPSISARWP